MGLLDRWFKPKWEDASNELIAEAAASESAAVVEAREKAIGDLMAEAARLKSYRDSIARLSRTQKPTKSGRDVLAAYETNGVVRRTVDKIAFNVAIQEWQAFRVIGSGSSTGRDWSRRMAGMHLRRPEKSNRQLLRVPLDVGARRDGRTTKELELLPGHPMLDLLYRGDGNSLFGYQTFQTIQMHLDLAGETFLEKRKVEHGSASVKEGSTASVLPLPPHWIRDPWPEGPGDVWLIQPPSAPLREIPFEDMIHVKYPVPVNPYGRGVGAAQSIAAEIDVDVNALETAAARLANGAMPAGIMQIENIQDDVAKRKEREFNSRHLGPHKAGRMIVTDKKIDFKKLDLSAADLKLVEQLTLNSERMIQTFGVPPEIMGNVNNSNRATIEAASYIFARWVLLPRLCFLESVINERLFDFLMPGENVSAFITFESPVQDFRETQLKLIENASGAFDVREIRELANMDPPEDEDYGRKVMVSNRVRMVLPEDVSKIAEMEAEAKVKFEPDNEPDGPKNDDDDTSE